MQMPSAADIGLQLNTLATTPKPQKDGTTQEKEVGAQFEAMFVQHLLGGMRQGSFGGRKDFARQSFEQMFDEEVARAVSVQGLGLGDALFAPTGAVRPQEAVATDDRGQ